jgi:uncharacterized protein with NAD-binding domain and iron-sulfur cluster
MRRRQRIAVLGGGMGGLAAAWRLSEPGWDRDFESITVYQRGWRLGGKGASSRGLHGRVEEHGLHVWLGWYENALRLLEDCYRELDRPARDPQCPIQSFCEALIPADAIGLTERRADEWRHWTMHMPTNNWSSSGGVSAGRDLTAVDFGVQVLRLVDHYFAALAEGRGSADAGAVHRVGAGLEASLSAAANEAVRLNDPGASQGAGRLAQIADPSGTSDDGLFRTWQGVALMTAAVRGILSDRLLTDPRGLRAINDEEYLDWVIRHGGAPELGDFSIIRGLYDLVFAYVDGDPGRPSIGAGTAVLYGGKSLLDYKGSFVWKMAAGMGDVVFAPIYQVLRQRGVDFEFFHRVDQLHPSADGRRIEAISMGRQVHLAPGRGHYDPLTCYGGLPCFPNAPDADQLYEAPGIEDQPLESHWCQWPDAERRVLRDGADFDVVVFGIPPGMAKFVCGELVAQRREWRDMVDRVATVATQALQLWIRDPEASLGWAQPGSTLSGFEAPFSTWASMPHLMEVEDWPAGQQPGTIAYWCGVLDAPPAVTPSEAVRQRARVRQNAIDLLETRFASVLPGVTRNDRFRWEILCGTGDAAGPARIDSQYWSANVDPSDRYVQSLPGTDRYRLRSDESAYDNLFLAGDWTDSGLNAGCIEAAVLSGLQAANAVQGRALHHRIAGYFMP